MKLRSALFVSPQIAAILFTIACVPPRKPLARSPQAEGSEVPHDSTQIPLPNTPTTTPTPSVVDNETALSLSDNCIRNDNPDQKACIEVGKYWEERKGFSMAFTYYSRACSLTMSQGLKISEEASGCSQAAAAASDEEAFSFKLMSCRLNPLSPVCVELCRMEIGAPIEIPDGTNSLPAWWTQATLGGTPVVPSNQIPTLCFAEGSTWFADEKAREEALASTQACFSNEGDAGVCRSAASSIQDSAATLDNNAKQVARKCAIALHEAACLRGKSVYLTKAPFTTLSCTQSASKLEQLIAAQGEPIAQEKRAAHLFCRIGIVGANTLHRSNAERGIAARCSAALAAETQPENLPYVKACRDIASYDAKIYATP